MLARLSQDARGIRERGGASLCAGWLVLRRVRAKAFWGRVCAEVGWLAPLSADGWRPARPLPPPATPARSYSSAAQMASCPPKAAPSCARRAATKARQPLPPAACPPRHVQPGIPRRDSAYGGPREAHGACVAGAGPAGVVGAASGLSPGVVSPTAWCSVARARQPANMIWGRQPRGCGEEAPGAGNPRGVHGGSSNPLLIGDVISFAAALAYASRLLALPGAVWPPETHLKRSAPEHWGTVEASLPRCSAVVPVSVRAQAASCTRALRTTAGQQRRR